VASSLLAAMVLTAEQQTRLRMKQTIGEGKTLKPRGEANKVLYEKLLREHKAHTTTEVAAGVRAVNQHTDAAVSPITNLFKAEGSAIERIRARQRQINMLQEANRKDRELLRLEKEGRAGKRQRTGGHFLNEVLTQLQTLDDLHNKEVQEVKEAAAKEVAAAAPRPEPAPPLATEVAETPTPTEPQAAEAPAATEAPIMEVPEGFEPCTEYQILKKDCEVAIIGNVQKERPFKMGVIMDVHGREHRVKTADGLLQWYGACELAVKA